MASLVAFFIFSLFELFIILSLLDKQKKLQDRVAALEFENSLSVNISETHLHDDLRKS